MRPDAALGELAIERDRRLVESDFDHRQVRRSRFEVVAECEAGDGKLGVAKFFEAAAKMDDHQIALVAQCRKERALAVLAPSHLGEQLRRLHDSGVAFHQIERAEFAAPQPEHLMENAVALERKRRGGKITGNLRAVTLLCAVAHGSNSRRYAAGCLARRERAQVPTRASAIAGFE